MPKLMEPPPCSPVEPVTEVLHGVTVTDPYRWLEDQDSAQTRAWLEAQTEYARAYLDSIPGRERIHQRVRELLDVETYDSIQKVGQRYFFRKRLPGQEQHCILMREGPDGEDCLLISPAERGTGKHTAVKPLRVSPDARLLLYEVKEGGERTGTFEVWDIESQRALPDVLPRGYLRGFAFASDSRSFYYVHEPTTSSGPHHRAVCHHVLGTAFNDDKQIFVAGDSDKIRLHMVHGKDQLGFLVYRFLDKPYTDFYLWRFGSETAPTLVIENAGYKFGPLLMKNGRILAVTDRDAPNSRIVRLRLREGLEPEFVDVIPATDVPIQNFAVTESRIFVSYTREVRTQIAVFDLFGNPLGELPVEKSDTVRLTGGSLDEDDLFFERESFTKPIQIYRYSSRTGGAKLWAERDLPFDTRAFSHTQVWFTAKDGIRIPMFLVGRIRNADDSGPRPAFLTGYGGFGFNLTPRFAVYSAFLLEQGFLLAIPGVRGGSEGGAEWHLAGKRQQRQNAIDDFLCAADWLVDNGYTTKDKLAIGGGSNGGLLVGAALTQRPDLFRAVVCLGPLLDMLRYDKFDLAHEWVEEYGSAESADDFQVLRGYSPYHRVEDATRYPAVMLISGDLDTRCNPMHVRKMAARLQAASNSKHPILLDYKQNWGHWPAQPLSARIQALSRRLAFICHEIAVGV